MAGISPTLRLIVVYLIDWVCVVLLAIGTILVNHVYSKARPFSLANTSISFPFTEEETVPMHTLIIIVAVVAIPCILLGTLVPAFWYAARGTGGGATVTSRFKAAVWRRAAWELHITVLGLLAAGVATIFMTESLKIMIGKPRPDCLSRCQPDLSRISDFVVGGIQSTLGTGQLVTRGICTNTDLDKVDDGFKSFPSGHASGAAAGLGYISLFLAGKFGVLSLATSWTNNSTPKAIFASKSSSSSSLTRLPHSHHRTGSADDFVNDDSPKALRHTLTSMSAPALSLTMIAWVPYAVAIFVAVSRWHDYRHHASDIFFGFFIGSVFAALAYRFTQLHLARAAGTPAAPSPVAEKEWRPVLAEDEEARLADLSALRPHTATSYAGASSRQPKMM